MNSNKNIKVLIAEDDFLISEEIIRVLKEKGFTDIVDASTGKEAFDMVCKLKPDIVLMDIKMPEMDGLEASKKIQEYCPTPIVILTAYEDKAFLEKASENRVSYFLMKPPDAAEIERAIYISMARHKDLMEIIRINEKLKLRNEELEKARAEIKTLRGILPICSGCKKIRNDKGYWDIIEEYISTHSEAVFSHGICPDCIEKIYGKEDWYKDN